MTDAEASFVERVAGMGATQGLPRMAGRIWAWLLICDPAEQTGADLARELHASRGSISSMARLLEAPGLIHRTTRRGDRREYFGIAPGSVDAVVHARLPAIVAWRRITEDGLRLVADRSPDSQARLRELHEAYAFFERDFPHSLERYEAARAVTAGTKTGRKKGAA